MNHVHSLIHRFD